MSLATALGSEMVCDPGHPNQYWPWDGAWNTQRNRLSERGELGPVDLGRARGFECARTLSRGRWCELGASWWAQPAKGVPSLWLGRPPPRTGLFPAAVTYPRRGRPEPRGLCRSCCRERFRKSLCTACSVEEADISPAGSSVTRGSCCVLGSSTFSWNAALGA